MGDPSRVVQDNDMEPMANRDINVPSPLHPPILPPDQLPIPITLASKMALEILATPVVDALIKNLGSAIWTKLGSLWGVKDEIERLRRRLSTINAVLEDAERRSINDVALRKWLKDLKDAAFDAEDVLDEFQTEALHKGKNGKVRRFVSSPNSVLFRCKMARKIKNILKVFDEIAEEREKFHLSESSSSIVSHLERETFSYVDEDETFGREDDKVKVMERLIEDGNDEDISVLPIVGLGGLGKTTLAKLVYNDEEIKKHFEIRMWVFVGEDFVVKDVAKAVLDKLGGQCTSSTLEDMRCHIQEKLANKRYLLILDDLWSEDESRWEALRDMLRGSGRGNKIVVTTRSKRVAEIIGTADGPYNLKVLTDDYCWILFKQRAFGQGRAQESSNLVKIGKEIAKRCGGLPLAAKSLGGLMATKQTEAEWVAIRNSEIWELEEGEKGILPALKLSYAHLPPHLKQCFSYCSVFPKGIEIDKLSLIQLWIALGFIQSKEGMQVEDIANLYFCSLLGRSFFQIAKEDNSGNITDCRMHDLIHDLACLVSQGESSTREIDENISFPHGCRFSSIIFHNDPPPTIKRVTCEAKKLRSLIFVTTYHYTGNDHLLFSKAISNLTHLRALQLYHLSNKDITCMVGKLKHLRFLELWDLEIEALPDSIADLHNLLTLNLPDCSNLKELPKGIKKLTNLRHLGIGDCDELTGMPRGLGGLTNLQTLPLFMVSRNQSHGTIAELQHLNQINGELKISGLHGMMDPKDAREAKMSSKAGLQSLILEWDPPEERSQPLEGQEDDVLEYLQPHPNLKSLEIYRYGGNRFPNWLRKMDLSSSPLPNLVDVSLRDVNACESLPMLGQLPSLERLNITGMSALKKIGREFYGESAAASGAAFPSLNYMSLSNAPDLEEWVVPLRDAFPCLQTLLIWYCPNLRIQPCLPSSLVELEITWSNEELLAAGGCLQGLSSLWKLLIERMEASKTSWKGLQYLTALEELNIEYCDKLIWLPEGVIQHHFSSLHTLQLTVLKNLESLGGGEESDVQQPPPPLFTSLHHLTIFGCPRLTALPEWLGGLTSLQSLTLVSCEELKMLPDGIRHLAGLKHLTIRGCPILAPRCLRETGEDWHKIAHIPNLQIKD